MSRVFLFNPYTGKPRHPSDIASDPEGLAIAKPVITAKLEECWACNGTKTVTTSSNGSGLIDNTCTNCNISLEEELVKSMHTPVSHPDTENAERDALREALTLGGFLITN